MRGSDDEQYVTTTEARQALNQQSLVLRTATGVLHESSYLSPYCIC
jgi:hypothetical protein